MQNQILDVVIVGAGLSGIDAAYHIQSKCPDRSYVIVDGRERIGGTWDLFRYPGVRSDSDIETLGFPFKKWTHDKSIADGATIRDYIEDAAREFGIYEKIRFGSKVVDARWSSAESLWTLTLAEANGAESQLACRFLYNCTGYYNYAEGYQPEWKGMDRFQGKIIHPQFWPESYNGNAEDVVVIGSGATAITLVPNLAKHAKSVTMLQRSPTFVVARPSIDAMSLKIKSILPKSWAFQAVRLKNIIYSMFVFQYAKRKPDSTRGAIMALARRDLPKGYDVKKHFNPKYNPWDQRLCLAPDGDFFKALHSPSTCVVTDEIESFRENGIQLKSGDFLPADTVVSATGLKILLVGGMKIFLDDRPLDFSQKLSYKGTFLSDVPNFAIALGYTNASWTLKCDLSARYVCRLFNYMAKHQYLVAVPKLDDPSIKVENLLNLSSNYVKRSEANLPKQGDKKPWRLNQNYLLDWFALKYTSVNDGTMKFSRG
jgi:monooxygenase